MAPLVKRSWAPVGEPPRLRCKGGHREKVSIAAALWWSPAQRRLGLLFQTLLNDYFNNAHIGPFLDQLLRRLPARVVVLWDRGNMHRGDPIRARVERSASRLQLEALPSYAPMLNPVECIWQWLKYTQLCNFVPGTAAQLRAQAIHELRAVAHDQEFLKITWRSSNLPLPRTLLLS